MVDPSFFDTEPTGLFMREEENIPSALEARVNPVLDGEGHRPAAGKS